MKAISNRLKRLEMTKGITGRPTIVLAVGGVVSAPYKFMGVNVESLDNSYVVINMLRDDTVSPHEEIAEKYNNRS